MKIKFVVGCFLIAAAFLFGAYFSNPSFWQAVLINTGTSFIALGIGLVLVNIYLEQNARKGAVKSLFVLSNSAIAGVHNHFLNTCWAKFGRDEFGKIIDEYVKSNGNPKSLKLEVREYFYELVKNDRALFNHLDSMAESLTELSRLVGWSLNASLLESSLNSRIAINKLKELDLDDSEDAKNSATEYLLDADLKGQETRHILLKLADIEE
ncbi:MULTISPECIES: hypothetical protein [unclassified Marinomonas]|uniref:hypothetical protein n=1 Tax=unclassified Marinomonas TaxID=196814 RepID=UPI001BAEFAFB|nr:hypothetical protein [Marinomonas sp. CT5]QUX95081.1 hypothetical protein C0J08_06465 [Marinomonas sp. CT5]